MLSPHASGGKAVLESCEQDVRAKGARGPGPADRTIGGSHAEPHAGRGGEDALAGLGRTRTSGRPDRRHWRADQRQQNT